MNTEITVHPKLQHFGLATANLDAMIDWYGRVLGMTINHRSAAPPRAQNGPSFSAAFASNDEVHHRIAFFEIPGLVVDPDKPRHARLQHVAFEYETLDDLMGTYVRLKGLGILPVMAADEGLQTTLYYADPDQNSVELNVNNYGNEWTATEHMKTWPSDRPRRVFVDPDKLIAGARRARRRGNCTSALSPKSSPRPSRTSIVRSSEPCPDRNQTAFRRNRMPIQVIGAGLGRTGTLSLKAALEELGFAKCYHMTEVLGAGTTAQTWDAATRGERVDWDRLFAGYRATVDVPSCVFYRELFEKYPEAKVILTVRDPEPWYDSASQTLYFARNAFPKWAALLNPRMRDFQRMIGWLWDGMFRGRFEDRAFAIDVFNRHNEQVRRDVPADRLLVYEISQGWGPLCEFLGVPVPEGKPFPHVNDAAQFRARVDAVPVSRGPSAMPPSARPRWCSFSSHCW